MKKHLLKSLALAAVLLVGGGSAQAQDDGDYLIQNVENGYYLAGGNSWGTQASTLGKPQWLGLAKQSDETYYLDSYQAGSSTSTSRYLGSNGYMDNGTPVSITFTLQDDGSYTMGVGDYYITATGKNAAVSLTGTDASAEAAHWKLITMEEYVAAQAEATASEPVDVTALIFNPELKRNCPFTIDGLGSWTTSSYDGTETVGNFNWGSGSSIANVSESYHSSNGFKVVQTLPSLATGIYSLDAQAFYRQDGSDTENLLYIFFSDQEAAIAEQTGTESSMVAAYASFLEGTYPTETVYLEVTDNNKDAVTVGFKNANTSVWNIFGELTLKYYGAETSVFELMQSDITDAQEAAAEAATLTVADASTQEDLTTALSALNALTSAATYNDITSAIAAVETAIAAVELSHASASATIEDGNYLIQNVETGYYLGGGNTWGTQASTLGKPQWLGLELQSDGTYHLDSHQSNGGSNHYLNVGGYLDTASPSAITITKVEDGIYTLYIEGSGYITSTGKNAVVDMAGTDGTLQAAQWKLITMADVLEEQAKATVDAPVDVTALIYNPEMKRNYTLEVDGLGSWTTSSYDGTESVGNFHFGDPNGATANVAESWHSSNGFKVVQTLPTLAVGVYSLDAHALYRQDGTDEDNLPIMFFSDETTTLPKITDDDNDSSSDTYTNSMALAYASFLNGNYPTETLYLEVTEENQSSVTIGFQNVNTAMWNIFGELTLKYYGTDANVAKVKGTVAADAYVTRIFPFTPSLPDGITVYSCSEIDADGETLLLETVETPAANVPYILYNSTDAEIDITTKTAFVDEISSTSVTAGYLTGMLEADYVPAGSYVLQTQSDGQAFYQVAEANTITCPAYRAYLTVDGSESIRAFTFGNGSATAISAIEALTSGNAEIYDLSGRKLSKLQKGVNIVNGKKVILK